MKWEVVCADKEKIRSRGLEGDPEGEFLVLGEHDVLSWKGQ